MVASHKGTKILNVSNIDNYVNLLYAICNSDEEEINGSCGVICVYDTLDNDKAVAVFSNTKTCSQFFHKSKETIACNISKGNLINHKYRLERVKV